MIEDIACVILAGGKSSRMGKDKALLPFGGYSSLAKYQYEKFSKIFKSVYISAKENKFDFECNLILDRYQEYSPMHALSSIFETIDFENIFLISVDMPFFSKEMVYKLKEMHTNEITCFNLNDNIEPFGAIYNNSLKNRIERFLKEGNYKLKNLILNSEYTTLTTSKNTDFININYQKEYLEYFSQNFYQ